MKTAIIALSVAGLVLLAAAQIIPPTIDAADKRIELCAVVQGTPPFTYQWYRGTMKIPAPEGTQQILSLAPPFVAGVYSCEVTNEAGSVRSRPTRISLTTVSSAPEVTVTVKKQ